MTDFVEEPHPEFQIGVRDPFLNIVYWVSSETEITFDDAKRVVSRFLADRARQFELDYQKVYSLPPLLDLILDKDNQILAPQLQTPEEVKGQENLVEKNREELLTGLQKLL